MPFSIRLTDIRPADVDIADLFEFISTYKEALLGMLAQLYPGINMQSVKVSLLEMREASAEAVLESNYAEEAKKSLLEIRSDIENNNFSRTPEGTRQSLTKLLSLSNKHRCQIEFYPEANNKQLVARLSPQHSELLRQRASYQVKGIATLFGKVETVGGAKPYCHLRISEKERPRIESDESIAKELGKRLYSLVGVRGVATWNSATMDIVGFVAKEVLPYKETSAKEAINAIKNADPDAWFGVEDVPSSIKDMR